MKERKRKKQLEEVVKAAAVPGYFSLLFVLLVFHSTEVRKTLTVVQRLTVQQRRRVHAIDCTRAREEKGRMGTVEKKR